MTVLLWLFKLGVNLPNSSTELYNSFICHTIQHHLVKHKVSVGSVSDLNTLQHRCTQDLRITRETQLIAAAFMLTVVAFIAATIQTRRLFEVRHLTK